MKKSTKIFMSFLFIILFGSMISTAVYVRVVSEKEATETEQQADETEQQTEQTQQTTSETNWTQYSTTDFFDSPFPNIGVTAVTAPLGENIISAFSKNTDDSGTVLHYYTIDEIFNTLLSRECDIVLSPAPSEEMQQQYGASLDFIPISNEAIVFLVNKKNSIQNLYLEDIQNIYSGQVTSWENFTREEKDIIAYQKPENSLLQYLFHSLVLSQGSMMSPPQQIRINENYELEKVISNYDGGEYAIGYDTYYYANTMLYDYNIKMLSIDGIYPTKRNIAKGIYPIMTNYYAVVRANSYTESPEQKLVQYLTSQTGQELIKQSGYIPLS
ncbi:substrate-binding domain-containing protein [Lachnospiraceae bacterium 46-61]